MPKKLSPKARRKEIEAFLKPFRVTNGGGFRLSRMNPGDTRGVKSKEDAQVFLKRGVEYLAEMQDKLYAQDQWGVLLVFQAMDAAGKDGAIKHVMSGINPQGCQVYSFKNPSSEELDHDFLWRTNRSLPGRGRIGIFNRSYYEEVLVVRVHPEIKPEGHSCALPGPRSADEGPRKWHTGYGGGLMLQLIGTPMALSGSLANGTEGVKFYVGGGYSF